jgi:Tfp pilus assembly protein PilE
LLKFEAVLPITRQGNKGQIWMTQSQSHRQTGYSIVELLFALTMIGIIAVLTIPSVIYRAENSNAMMQSKYMASELKRVAEKYMLEETIAPASADNIANLLKYTRRVTTNVPPLVTDAGVSCSNVSPCYKYPDGSVLVPQTTSLPVGGWTMYTFHYDPDGRMAGLEDLDGVELRIYYSIDRGLVRITTKGADTGSIADDPEYVHSWTKM